MPQGCPGATLVAKSIARRNIENALRRYGFVHAMYQDALSAGLAPARRAAVCRAAADALLALQNGQPGLAAAELALLYEAGREFGRAADLCLPSLAEEGRRLHEMPSPSVYWLDLLLRQHEACWTADEPRERLRVFDWPILHGPSGPC